jgi:hypothetical protein
MEWVGEEPPKLLAGAMYELLSYERMLGSAGDRGNEVATGVADAIDALLALDPDTLHDRELADLAVEFTASNPAWRRPRPG